MKGLKWDAKLRVWWNLSGRMYRRLGGKLRLVKA